MRREASIFVIKFRLFDARTLSTGFAETDTAEVVFPTIIFLFVEGMVPTGSAANHGYDFQFPEGEAKHKGKDYVLSTKHGSGEGKAVAGNFFTSVVQRGMWEGALQPVWKLVEDPVRFKYAPKKPTI